jgi:hypothetical protein
MGHATKAEGGSVSQRHDLVALNDVPRLSENDSSCEERGQAYSKFPEARNAPGEVQEHWLV